MRKTVFLLLGSLLLPAFITHADEGDDAADAARDVQTLFFGHDDRTPVPDPAAPPGTLSASSKPRAAICVPPRLSPRIWR